VYPVTTTSFVSNALMENSMLPIKEGAIILSGKKNDEMNHPYLDPICALQPALFESGQQSITAFGA